MGLMSVKKLLSSSKFSLHAILSPIGDFYHMAGSDKQAPMTGPHHWTDLHLSMQGSEVQEPWGRWLIGTSTGVRDRLC